MVPTPHRLTALWELYDVTSLQLSKEIRSRISFLQFSYNLPTCNFTRDCRSLQRPYMLCCIAMTVNSAEIETFTPQGIFGFSNHLRFENSKKPMPIFYLITPTKYFAV
jgi:hypothetical protein